MEDSGTRGLARRWTVLAGLVVVVGCGSDAGSDDGGTDPEPDGSAHDAGAEADAGADAAAAEGGWRVLFLVDASQSLTVNDPPDPITLHTGRRVAVAAAMDALAAEQGDRVRFAVARVGAETSVLTTCDTDGDGILDADCFTSDGAVLEAAVGALDEAGGMSSWVSAFDSAGGLIAADLDGTPADTVDHAVVMITDGAPSEQRDDVVQALLRLVDAADQHGALSLAVHVAQILGGVTQPEPFLESLAERGSGRYQTFDDPQEMDLLPLLRGP